MKRIDEIDCLIYDVRVIIENEIYLSDNFSAYQKIPYFKDHVVQKINKVHFLELEYDFDSF